MYKKIGLLNKDVRANHLLTLSFNPWKFVYLNVGYEKHEMVPLHVFWGGY